MKRLLVFEIDLSQEQIDKVNNALAPYQIGGAKEEPFGVLCQPKIGNHRLQFAVVDRLLYDAIGDVLSKSKEAPLRLP